MRERRQEAVLQLVGVRQRLVATLQCVLQLLQVSAIRDDLAEAQQRAVRCTNRGDRAEAPEARAVLAHVPALVGGASHAFGGLQFQARDTGVAVLLREDVVQLAAEHVALIEAHDLRSARIPVLDTALRIHGEDCVILHVLHELVEQLVAVRRRRLTGIGHFVGATSCGVPGGGVVSVVAEGTVGGRPRFRLHPVAGMRHRVAATRFVLMT